MTSLREPTRLVANSWQSRPETAGFNRTQPDEPISRKSCAGAGFSSIADDPSWAFTRFESLPRSTLARRVYGAFRVSGDGARQYARQLCTRGV